MGKPVRLPSRVRRQAIVAAVRGTFAEKGFDGTTTRELARAAGVSEALLYKHFPSKESLYAAMLDACANGPMAAEFTRVLALPPSTSTLVVLVHFLTSQFVLCEDEHKITMHRLALRSLLEDADFVRLGAKQFAAGWVRKVEACVRAAAKAGRAPGNPRPTRPARMVRPPSGVRPHGPSPAEGPGHRLRNPQDDAGRPSGMVRVARTGARGRSDPASLSPRGPVSAETMIGFLRMNRESWLSRRARSSSLAGLLALSPARLRAASAAGPRATAGARHRGGGSRA